VCDASAEACHVEVGTGVECGPGSFDAGLGAARQAMAVVGRHAPCLVLVFASVRHDLPEVVRGVRAVTGEAPLVGATTAGEILDREHRGSVVVTVVASPFVRAHVGSGAAVAAGWERALDGALSAPGVSPYFGAPAGGHAALTSSGGSAFAILLSPGNTRHAVSRSFDLLEAMKRRSLGRVPIFGGAAADDWRMDANHVFAGSQVIRDGVVVALVETELQFGIAMAHGLRSAGATVTVTEAQGHEVLSLDGRPAADAYAELIGSTREALGGEHLSLGTGRLVGTPDLLGAFIPNVASYFTARGGVLFTRAVSPGTELTLLDADPQACANAGVDAARKAMVRGGIAAPALALVSYCALRPKVLGALAGEEIPRTKRALPGAPVVGFASFGEAALSEDGASQHTNAVVASLVLGRDLSFAARVARENDALRRAAERQAAQLARAHDDLERAVAERTQALVALNDTLLVEITERKRAEALAHRHLRALRTLTECNEALVRETSEPALLDMLCRSVVESGGYRMCWVGFAEHDEQRTVRPVAQRGFDHGYLDSVAIVWSDTERGRGPVGTAIRTRRPVVVRDVLEDPSFLPWREQARLRGFRSVAALPLVVDGVVLGAFGIYAAEENAFADEAEVRLLLDLADDLAYGIAALRARAERAEMAARMMQSDRLAAVGTLAAGVAHEINNPLAYVLAGVELAKQKLDRGLSSAAAHQELREILEEVRQGSERIRHIVKDLRTFSRVDEQACGIVDVRQVLDCAAKMTSNELRHRARVVKRYGPVPHVLANEARLVQVFVNLLINAAHAIPEGRVDANEILLATATDERGRAVVEVQDSGAGIDPAVRERIFEPFFTTKPMGIGTGLGLSICRNIVLSLGGEISVSSRPGEGTRFRIAVPASPPTAQAGAPQGPATPDGDGVRGRLLVVDDEQLVLAAIQRALEEHHQVTCEADGRRALRRIEAGERFDLVLCDLMMPEMTGMEFHAAVSSAAPELADRIVFVTGGAFTPSAEAFLAGVPNPRIEKPFRMDELRSLVHSALRS
jgi:signal transduction histidine kinase/CheY-like chemotaxis protein